jgi:hypothetical protein
MTTQDNRDAHALAIGKIAVAWNEYHELLGELFAGLFTHSHYETTLAIWQCLDSDRTQRKLLRAAARHRLGRITDKTGLEELTWLLNKTDTILAQQRNVGVHAPLMFLWEMDGSHKILPLLTTGNRNAKHIEGQDILREYAHYERQIRKMIGFAMALSKKIGYHKRDHGPWPERPTLSGRAPR